MMMLSPQEHLPTSSLPELSVTQACRQRSLVRALGSYLGEDGFARRAEKMGGEERLTCTALIQGLHSEEHLPPEV